VRPSSAPAIAEQAPRPYVLTNVNPRALCVLTLAYLSGWSTSGCTQRESSAEGVEAFRSIPVASPVVRDVVVRREYVAGIKAARHAEVRARFKGIIESVAVDEGEPVKAGQLLFTINARARKQDVAVARAATVGARAELHAAELDLQSTQLLADKNIVSEAELERARSKVEMLRARVDEANATAARAGVELDRADLRATFDGVVDRIPHKAGSAVEDDELLTTVSDTSEVFAYFSISEPEYLELVRSSPGAEGRLVSLELADGSRFPYVGQIDAVGSEFDPQTGTLAYRARFPNKDGTLKHGSSGKVIIETTLRGAVLVPQQATFEVQGDVYAFVVDTDDVVHARKIHVKERLDDAFVVDAGLARGDRYVVEGIQQVKDGMRIAPRDPDRQG